MFTLFVTLFILFGYAYTSILTTANGSFGCFDGTALNCTDTQLKHIICKDPDLKLNCRLSCKVCVQTTTPATTTISLTSAKPVLCVDSNALCTDSLKQYVCQNANLKPNCPKMCNLCVKPTSPPAVIQFQPCDKLRILTAMAAGAHAENLNATKCPNGSYTNADSLVMNVCSGLPSSQWKRGLQVAATSCDSIPAFTPIAQYKNLQFTGKAGIKTSCQNQGHEFEMITQSCGQPINITYIKFPDSLTYFTVNWSPSGTVGPLHPDVQQTFG